jgi:MFS family permease
VLAVVVRLTTAESKLRVRSRVDYLGALLLGAGLAGVLTGLVNDSRGVVIVWAAIQGLGLGLCYAATPNLVIQAVPGELQGSMASMVQVFQGAFSAAIPVVVFTVLNSGKVTVLKGNIFYSNSGLTIGFLIGGATALVAALVAVALPQRTLGAAPAARKTDAEPAPLTATTVTG